MAMAAAAVDSCLKGGDIEMKKKARGFFFFLSFFSVERFLLYLSYL